jgi:hypothetical protein
MCSRHRLVSLSLLLFACTARLAFVPDAAAEIVTLPAAHDNTLFEDAEGDTSNGAGPAFFAGRNGQGRARRAVVRFDLAGAVPDGSHIDAVRLELVVSSAPDEIARPFALHRLRAPWGEGASSSSGGGGAPATAGDATWRHTFFPAVLWAAPGGDFEPVASAAQFVGDVGPSAWSGAGLDADVARWLADPATNHGWILIGDESSARTVRRFDSRETIPPAVGPCLTIEFTPPEPVPSLAQTWGRIKSAYRRGDP